MISFNATFVFGSACFSLAFAFLYLFMYVQGRRFLIAEPKHFHASLLFFGCALYLLGQALLENARECGPDPIIFHHRLQHVGLFMVACFLPPLIACYTKIRYPRILSVVSAALAVLLTVLAFGSELFIESRLHLFNNHAWQGVEGPLYPVFQIWMLVSVLGWFGFLARRLPARAELREPRYMLIFLGMLVTVITALFDMIGTFTPVEFLSEVSTVSYGVIAMCLTFSFELTAASIQGAGELVRANHLIKEQENALLEKARFDLIGRIASGTIHDMRNLLAIISLANGNLETQCRDAGPTLSLVAQQRAAIEIMELELGNLYGFARDGFPAAAMPGAFSPGQVLSSLERMLQSRLEVRNIRLVLDVPFTLNLAGSGSHFMQVALNLLFNSVDALGSGGTIEVNAVKDGKDRALLRFIDDGPGISEEIREKVFEFLYTTKMAGTGIGLYVARRIVEAYLGTISVGVSESGCLIELWWPLSET